MPKGNPKDEPHLREILRGKGLRVTDQRLTVLRELKRVGKPVSHAELHDRLAADFDRVTVYRNLLALTEAGILVKTDLGDHLYRFGLADEEGQPAHTAHPHFVCVDCGSIRCLPANSVALHLEASRQAVITEVQLKGHCADCVG